MGGGSGALRWRWRDYRKYADGEWDEIGQAVEDDKPVVVEITNGDFPGSGGDGGGEVVGL